MRSTESYETLAANLEPSLRPRLRQLLLDVTKDGAPQRAAATVTAELAAMDGDGSKRRPVPLRLAAVVQSAGVGGWAEVEDWTAAGWRCARCPGHGRHHGFCQQLQTSTLRTND